MYRFDKYRKFLLNRMTSSQEIIEYIENSLITEDEMAKHSFHKVMICRWQDGGVKLFETLYEYFGLIFIPVDFVETNLLTTFYTNSLMLILKIIKFDFMFPHCRNMFSVDILLNFKTSSDCFEEKFTVEDIVTHIVSHRFNEHRELNLSALCNEPAFKEKKIYFYKLSLLSYFKILMIRMGRDTKILNLSSNNLSQVPLDILNFFIKGDLIGVNLSNNNIQSVAELQRISSRVERLWVEGNPLCEDDLDPVTYIRQIAKKFPRLTELDGVPLNEHGIMMPFFRNFVITPNRKTKLVIENFVALYFGYYDSMRTKIEMLYDTHANLSLTANFTVGRHIKDQNQRMTKNYTMSVNRIHVKETDPPYHGISTSDMPRPQAIRALLPIITLIETPEYALTDRYIIHSRNFLVPEKRAKVVERNAKLYKSRHALVGVLNYLPESVHDPASFTVDVMQHDEKSMVLVIDGVYKDRPVNRKERFIHFRRTFVMFIAEQAYRNVQLTYTIAHEMFSVSLASPEVVANCFKDPIRNINQMTLIDPDPEDIKTLCSIFSHYTQLKKSEAEARLKQHDWDIRKTLKQFMADCTNDTISPHKFLEDDDFTDVSSLLEDEIE